MSDLAAARKEGLLRRVEHFDNAFCVAVFFAGCMPAIVVMLLIAFPLLPLFGVWVSWVATTGGPASEAGHEVPRADDTESKDQPRGHAPPTPRYA